MSNTEIKLPPQHVLFNHFFIFDKSLKCWQKEYISLLFQLPPTNPKYFVYVCPLCTTSLIAFENGQFYATSEFTEDHFPPESVGGKQTILVCKSCNNNAGSDYENSLKEKLEYVSFEKRVPNSFVKVKSVINDIKGWHHSALSVSDNNDVEFQITHKDKNRFRELTEWEQETNNGGKGWSMTITIKSPPPEKVEKGLLKTAFLYCFSNWGYDFVYSDAGKLIRSVLNGEAMYPIKTGWLWLDHQTPVDNNEKIPTGLCFISDPIELQCLMVNIPMSIKDNQYACVVPVIIPAPTDEGIAEAQKIQLLLEANPSQTIKIIRLNDCLLSNKVDAYNSIWRDLKNQFKCPNT